MYNKVKINTLTIYKNTWRKIWKGDSRKNLINAHSRKNRDSEVDPETPDGYPLISVCSYLSPWGRLRERLRLALQPNDKTMYNKVKINSDSQYIKIHEERYEKALSGRPWSPHTLERIEIMRSNQRLLTASLSSLSSLTYRHGVGYANDFDLPSIQTTKRLKTKWR